jgi:hypothetical protein
MIQRKQTLFLLAVAIIAVIQFFLPFQTLISTDGTWPICLMPGCSSNIIDSPIYIPMVLNFMVLVLSFVTIFLYKNRVFQYKLANLNALFNVFIIGFFFLLSFVKDNIMGSLNYEVGAFLPVISAIFAFIAAHFIKKDEILVRNVDRIR